MCGIAGIINPDSSADRIRFTLQQMTDVLVHRGPDDEGFYATDGAGLGMRRLSIIDVAGGQQPIGNEDGQIQVICNGEIYNHRELRPDLEARGHRFRTMSDAEVIVHLYEEKGSACFDDLRGMFGCAIWDNRHRRLILARDRLGKKPLFYAESNGSLLFGSEIKAILAADGTLAEPNPHALLPYLRFGAAPEPLTMFRRIRKLPAANYLIHESGRTIIEPYWEVNYSIHDQPSKTPRQWAEELDDLIEESVRLRLMSEVPLGVFLSGGLDSSAMVAYAHRAGLRPLKTFTIGFDRPDWDESADAQLVADHYETEHHVLHLREEEMKRNLPDTLMTLVRHFDEPFGDQSSLPMYLVSKLAREHVTVILSGDGGDELFAGYNTYQGIKFAEQYRRLPQWLGARFLPNISAFAANWLPTNYQYRAKRVAKVLRDSSLPFEQSYFRKSSCFDEVLLRNLLSDDMKSLVKPGSTHFPDHIQPVFAKDWPTINKQGFVDLRLGLLEGMLVKVDRMSMAHSLEVRSPLLDHRLVEFATSLPPSLKLRGWEKKAILRDVMRPQLPARTLRKRKQGFCVPLRDWLRTSFDEMVGDFLDYGGGGLPTELFDHATVRSLVNQHRRGDVDHSSKLWSLLNYAAWQAQYVNQAVINTVN